MKIKFVKNGSRIGLGYFAGDKIDVKKELAMAMIETGIAVEDKPEEKAQAPGPEQTKEQAEKKAAIEETLAADLAADAKAAEAAEAAEAAKAEENKE